MSLLILESALRALALAIAAWAVLRLLRVRNVPAQKCAWMAVLILAIAMPMLLRVSARWSAWPITTVRIPVRAERHEPAANIDAPIRGGRALMQPTAALYRAPAALQRSSAPGSSVQGSRTDRFPAPVVSTDYAPVAPRPAHAIAIASLIWPIYLAVCGLFLIRLAHGLVAVMNMWRNAEPVAPEALRLAPGLAMRCSGAVSSPVSTWAGVVLPLDYMTWDEKKLRIVLAHERSHIRQGDFYLQLIAGIYQALMWFSPLGWWLKRKLSDLGEAISDRAGLAEATSCFSYAQILLEFAAAPRTAQIGVAMARPSSLSRRMERLLNESQFKQAFAGSRRTLIAALLAPVLLFAASAFVRVEAAPIQAATPTSGQSHPDAAPILDSPDAQPKPGVDAKPAPNADTVAATAAANAARSADAAGRKNAKANAYSADRAYAAGNSYSAAASYAAGAAGYSSDSAGDGVTSTISDGHRYSYANDGSYAASYADDGDAYALVLNNQDHVAFSGNWNDSEREEIERARKAAGTGSFLWFKRDGTSYIITDPATIQRIADMYKPLEEMAKQQEVLGRQQEALGKQQEAIEQARANAKVDTPEFSEQMAKLKANLAALQQQIDKQVTETTVEQLQAKLAELQAHIGEIQSQIGARQGEFGEQQGKLGEEEGQLGEQQGRLGEQQGKLGREIDIKVKSIIDESLKDGKAQPEK